MGGLLSDLRPAGRRLLRSPGFALVALAMLALATGLNAVVFTVVDALLLRPLPVRAPGELVRLYSRVPGELMSHAPLSSADWGELRRSCPSFRSVAASSLTTGALDDGGTGRIVVAELVSGDYFETLGVGAAAGRVLEPADGRPRESRTRWGGEAVAVLGHEAWRRRFGSDPAVVGRVLRFAGRPVTVVGVAPAGFFGLARGLSPELWLPMGEPGPPTREDRERRHLWLVARLAPGASLQAARREVRATAEQLRRTFPDTHRDRGFAALASNRVRVLPGLDPLLYPASLAALAVVGLALLIANLDVAQLLLVRGLERRREIAIRLALGARRAKLARELLAEGVWLALAGSVLGVAFAVSTPALLARLSAALPVRVAMGLSVDWRVLAFTLGLPLLVTLACAVAPVLDATRVEVLPALRRGELGGGRARRRLRQGLVAGQVALAFVAVIAALTALGGLARALAVDPGFAPRGAAVAVLAPRLGGAGREDVRALDRRLRDALARDPEVAAAGLASHLPLTVEVLFERVAADPARVPEDEWPLVDTALVGPGYFEAVGTALVAGRAFDEADLEGAARNVVVNRELARRLWPGQDAVGRRLRVAGHDGSLEVVGVVQTGRYRTLLEPPRPCLFQPLQTPRAGRAGEVALGTQVLVVRGRAGEGAALDSIRAALDVAAPGLTPVRLASLAEVTSLPGLVPRALASLFAGVALAALALVALGVVGIAGYSASRRRREFGVRLALGARPSDVRGLLLRESLGVALLGCGAGALLAAAAAPRLALALPGAARLPAVAWPAAFALLAGLVVAAALVPANRAARADPQRSLRAE